MAKNNDVNRQFAALTFGYMDQLFRFAYARVGNTQDAEDIVQETYLKGYRAFHTVRKGDSIKGWLIQILMNNVRDHFRAASRAVQTVNIVDTHGENLVEPLQTGPEERLCDLEIDPALLKALNSMPPACVTPLLLREIHDATYSEIAALLNVPMGTVMSRLSRARVLLRKRLLVDGDSYGLRLFPNRQDNRPDSGGCCDALQ